MSNVCCVVAFNRRTHRNSLAEFSVPFASIYTKPHTNLVASNHMTLQRDAERCLALPSSMISQRTLWWKLRLWLLRNFIHGLWMSFMVYECLWCIHAYVDVMFVRGSLDLLLVDVGEGVYGHPLLQCSWSRLTRSQLSQEDIGSICSYCWHSVIAYPFHFSCNCVHNRAY